MTKEKTFRSKKKTDAVLSVVYYFFLLLIILITIFPFVFMLLASFKTTVEIQDPTKFLNFNFIITNYIEVFQRYDFSKPIWNSFYTALLSTLFSLLIGLPASYAIAHYRFHKISAGILVTRMIPGICFLLPWFKTFAAIHLTDTYLSLILSYMIVSVPFIIWIMVPHFENLPNELFEAAMLDGCSEHGTFIKVLLPLVRPGVVTAALMSFIYSWNNFLFALVLSGYNTKTLPMAVYNFIGYAKISWGPLMAAATMITGPIVLISLIMQKHVVSGMTAGAVKG